jgi:hypothetical protein
MFQVPVESLQAGGYLGEVSKESPYRVQTWNINSDDEPGRSPIGAAYTEFSDGEVRVGGTGEFVGILVQPKEYVAYTTFGPLDPSFFIKDYSVGQFLDMGIVWVNLFGPGEVGDGLVYDIIEGQIHSAVTTPPSSDFILIPNGKIIDKSITSLEGGLAKIQLTN